MSPIKGYSHSTVCIRQKTLQDKTRTNYVQVIARLDISLPFTDTHFSIHVLVSLKALWLTCKTYCKVQRFVFLQTYPHIEWGTLTSTHTHTNACTHTQKLEQFLSWNKHALPVTRTGSFTQLDSRKHQDIHYNTSSTLTCSWKKPQDCQAIETFSKTRSYECKKWPTVVASLMLASL